MFTGVRVPDCDFVGGVRMGEGDLAIGDSEEAVTWTDESDGAVTPCVTIDVGAVAFERMVEWNHWFDSIREIVFIDLELVDIGVVSNEYGLIEGIFEVKVDEVMRID